MLIQNPGLCVGAWETSDHISKQSRCESVYEAMHALIVCSSQIMRLNQLSSRFMTRKGRSLCAPTAAEEQWVKEHIKFLDTRLKKCKEIKFSVCNLPQIYL